jgi:D-amino-acid oxidase
MNICIIGSGWYGLHSALLLKDKYNITILEKENDIFCKSSYYNQNRLHLGYHYPRCKDTINMCKTNFDLFIEYYNNCVEDISKNVYFISKESKIDIDKYESLFLNYNHIVKMIDSSNSIISNVYNKYFIVNEKIINNAKAKEFFIKKLSNCSIIKKYNVVKIKQCNNKIIINDSLVFDKIIDCTNNQLGLSKFKYNYEVTLSLIYKKIKQFDYDAITIMDGNFFSLYPQDNTFNLYTLTHVKYTPIFIDNDYSKIADYIFDTSTLNNYINIIEKDVCKYFPDFNKYFEYSSYFISHKTKLINDIDSRPCTIEKNDNIISVNCGKIIGIFELEKYLLENLDI